MMTVSAFAPAKINLSLHVTGQNEAGYHLLDSLVAFASYGDEIAVTGGHGLSLAVKGPEGDAIPTGSGNLAYRAANLLVGDMGAAVTLTKRLPSSSGIGGGSADAAAAFRAMLAFGEGREIPANSMWFLPDEILETHARALLGLGADVPMCLMSRSVRARGVGEKLTFLEIPPLPAVLVNPRQPVATSDVFGRLRSKDNPPMPDDLPKFDKPASVIDFLHTTRNDLEAAAQEGEPAVSRVLDALIDSPECRLARMSGSGATCFGLFETRVEAGHAALALRRRYPDWWIVDCWLGDQMTAAMPRADAPI